MLMEKFLSELRKGESGVIKKILDKGPFNRRIRDMGMIPGCIVAVEGVAPLGDPIQIKIKGCSLALRKDEAQKIVLDVCE